MRNETQLRFHVAYMIILRLDYFMLVTMRFKVLWICVLQRDQITAWFRRYRTGSVKIIELQFNALPEKVVL